MRGRDQGSAGAPALRRSFQAYLDADRAGRPGAWRFLLGLILIVASYVAGFVASLALATSVYVALGGDAQDVARLDGNAPIGARTTLLAAALAGVGATTLAVAFALRSIHGRSFASVLGAERRFRPRAALLGAAASLAAISTTTPIAAGLGLIELEIVSLPPYWPAAAVVIAILVAFQASAEEIVFRGYILQWLGARFRSPIVWAAAPSLLFGLLHISGGGAALMASYVAMTTAFGLFAAALVWLTGGLSHAIGYHVANNLIALLIFEPPMGIDGVGAIKMSMAEADLPLLVLVNMIGLLVAYGVVSAFATPETPAEAAPAEADAS